MYNEKMRNIEIPENLFSNLGELKSRKNDYNNPIYNKSSITKEKDKFVNYSNIKDYRERITKMYDEINDLKPIDAEIDNVLYFNNYIEKGIVVKPKVSSLKQFWTEYRLMNNEKKIIKTKEENLETDSFDELFEALSVRLKEINKYIDELKEMKTNITNTSKQLEKDKEKLIDERQKFIDYKTKEENKLKEEKENLKINFSKLQSMINDLDKKLENLEKE